MIDNLKELIANATESGEIFLSDFEVLNDFVTNLSEADKEIAIKKINNLDDVVFKEFDEFNKRFESIFG